MSFSVTKHYESWKCELLQEPQPATVPPHAWQKYFPTETIRINELEVIRCRNITIEGLTTLVSQLGNNPQDNRVVFVATMMWGRGPKNGRLMPKFQLATDHPKFDATLRMTRESILNGRPGDAYRVWIESGVSGIREPFFTKWFFTCGLDAERTGLQPFTLDSRVRRSLKTIGWPDAAEKPAFRGRPDLFYEAYLIALAEWSKQLSQPEPHVTPLQVEQFLFRKNGAVPLAPS